jgi:hypothetical protein
MAASSQPATTYPPEYLSQDISSQLFAADTIILAITTVLLVLRYYAGSLTTASKGWNDLLLFPAWILVVGAVICGYSKFFARS